MLGARDGNQRTWLELKLLVPASLRRSGREAPDGILQVNTINWGSIKSKPPVQGCSQTHRSHRYWESVVGMGESAGVQGTYKGQGLPP